MDNMLQHSLTDVSTIYPEVTDIVKNLATSDATLQAVYSDIQHYERLLREQTSTTTRHTNTLVKLGPKCFHCGV